MPPLSRGAGSFAKPMVADKLLSMTPALAMDATNQRRDNINISPSCHTISVNVNAKYLTRSLMPINYSSIVLP
jgi:hypothetical protein